MRRWSLGVGLGLCLLLACADDPPGDGNTDSSEGDGDGDGDGDGEPFLPPELIVDAEGRALILHGINVMNASKSQPDRLPPITQADVDRIARDWGFNVVRLLIFWDAIEPSEGSYDELYLEAVAERVQWFADAGVYVILDMHQDVYSSVFCCDGAPAWAIEDDGEPFEQQSIWSVNYLQPAVQRAFDNFWAGDAGSYPYLQDAYVEAWRHVAERFAGDPWVLGYDLMNEPHPGSATVFADIDSPTPTPELIEWGSESLTPMYDRAIAVIREVDEDHWIFYEPRYGAAAAGHPSVLEQPHDPRADGPRLVYYPHLYPLEPEIFGTWDPSNPTLNRWEQQRGLESQAFGGPMLLGEFGVLQDWAFGPELLTLSLEMADRATTGWTYWSYDTSGRGPLDAEGNELPTADIFTRAYARRVAGTPIEHGYDVDTRVMVLRFEDRAGVDGPTEIFVPAARHYPGGWELIVDDPDGSWSSTWDEQNELLSVWTDSAQGSEHRLEIRPQ